MKWTFWALPDSIKLHENQAENLSWNLVPRPISILCSPVDLDFKSSCMFLKRPQDGINAGISDSLESVCGELSMFVVGKCLWLMSICVVESQCLSLRKQDVSICKTSQRLHNKHDGVSNYRRLDCLLNCLFRHRSKKTSHFHVTGLCEENPLVTGGFASQRASNIEKVSIW